jgi:YfiH family protein
MPQPTAALLEAIGLSSRRLVLARQRHTHNVVRLSSGVEADQGNWDALITDNPKLVLGIQTADCVPALIVDPARRTIGAVHAGWRGSLARILTRTIAAMSDAFGTEPADLRIVMGPAIGECCYEVGTEVAHAFAEHWPLAVHWLPSGKARLDLRQVNSIQAQVAGVPSNQVWQTRACTRCRPEDFPSYRRDGKGCGRILTLVALD